MKQYSFFLVSLFLTSYSYAQLEKKTWLVGGNGSLYSYNETYTSPTYSNTAKYTNIDVSASFGYFIIDKLATGLRPTFSSFKGKVTSPGGGTTNSYKIAIGPFARYYFLNADKPFNILADVGYQLGLNQRLGALHSRGKNNTFSVMAGTEVFFNSTAGLEILFGYTQNVLSIENSADEFIYKKSGFLVSIGFTLHLEKL